MSNLKSSILVFPSKLGLTWTLFVSLFLTLSLTLSLSLSFAAALAQTNKTLTVRPETGEFAGKTFYTNSHALVIGISNYAYLPKEKWLDYAAKDAADLRDVLIKSYGFLPENVTVLLNAQATKANIEHALSDLADDTRVKSDDRVLIFFSGHGQTVKSTTGGDMGFLIPYDAKVDLAHPENRGPYLNSCLPMDHIWSYVEGSPAKHSLVIADACFGGLLIRGRALSSERPSASVVTSLLSRPAQQALTAGGKGEEAKEDPKLGHGYLTFKLLEELKAQSGTPDTVFLASQLASSLKTSVANLTSARQTPQFGNHNETEGDFVFVTTEAKPVPPLVPIRRDPPVIANPDRPVVPAGNAGVPQIAKTKINQKDGAVMIFIPAGEFLMGDDDQKDNPRHKVTLTGYWMYKDLVTVGMYKRYCKETGKQMPQAPDFNPFWNKEDHPIVNVSWYQAVDYCTWAGATLPSEAQWEKAARGTDGRIYPWGNEFDSTKVPASSAAYDDAGGTTPVGVFAVSPYGCTDMVAYVCQWCIDWYDDEFWSSRFVEVANPVNLKGKYPFHVARGGYRGNDHGHMRASNRGYDIMDHHDGKFGFRCAAGQ